MELIPEGNDLFKMPVLPFGKHKGKKLLAKVYFDGMI
jgi:hypothetical protein